MEKKYVVKDFKTGTYFQGWDFGWSNDLTPYEFNDLEDAEEFIRSEGGKFQIETIYNI
jgi:hypothetical protein